MYKLSSSLALLILAWGDLASASLSYCRASSPCTIFEDSYYITFQTENYVYTTFTDAKEYSSFQSSLSAKSSASPFEITVASNTAATAITPPPITIETKPGQFTTISCCGSGMVHGYFVLNGEEGEENGTTATVTADDTTCGARSTMLFNMGNFTYNDFTVTVARSATIDVEKVLGSHTCVTIEPGVQAPMGPMPTPPPVTKTFVAELVVNTRSSSSSDSDTSIVSETIQPQAQRSTASSIDRAENTASTIGTAESGDVRTAKATATTEPIEVEVNTAVSNRTAVVVFTTPSSSELSSSSEPRPSNASELRRPNGTIYITASEGDIISNGNWTRTVHVVVTASVPLPTITSKDEIKEEATTSASPSRRIQNNGERLQVVYSLWMVPISLISLSSIVGLL